MSLRAENLTAPSAAVRNGIFLDARRDLPFRLAGFHRPNLGQNLSGDGSRLCSLCRSHRPGRSIPCLAPGRLPKPAGTKSPHFWKLLDRPAKRPQLAGCGHAMLIPNGQFQTPSALPGSSGNELQSAVEGRDHMAEVVTVLENKAGCRNHRKGALLAREPRVFLDPVERKLASAPVDGKDRLLGRKIDRIIPPFSVADFAAIEFEDFLQLVPAKRNNVHRASWSRADPVDGLTHGDFACPRGLRFGIFFSGLDIIHGCPAPG
jgi:hypothetical protein